MQQNTMKIYQAPLQGSTDFDFRITLAELIGGIDKYFIPYLSYGKGREIKRSQLRDVFPENNTDLPVVPQVLFSDTDELIDLISILIDYGYQEINLNLGCPYPMVTNKGRGAAWLTKPEVLEQVLNQLFSRDFKVQFTVKMRSGMDDPNDAVRIFEVLNKFPLGEVIFHPRTADQMYNGKANPQIFAEAQKVVKHSLIYNGDICSVDDLLVLKELLPAQDAWMIGRGLLSNPFLARQLKGEEFSRTEMRRTLELFHQKMFERYSMRLDGMGHILTKMTQFWEYFSESFDNPHKALKLVKKSKNLQKYNAAVAEIFRNY